MICTKIYNTSLNYLQLHPKLDAARNAFWATCSTLSNLDRRTDVVTTSAYFDCSDRVVRFPRGLGRRHPSVPGLRRKWVGSTHPGSLGTSREDAWAWARGCRDLGPSSNVGCVRSSHLREFLSYWTSVRGFCQTCCCCFCYWKTSKYTRVHIIAHKSKSIDVFDILCSGKKIEYEISYILVSHTSLYDGN